MVAVIVASGVALAAWWWIRGAEAAPPGALTSALSAAPTDERPGAAEWPSEGRRVSRSATDTPEGTLLVQIVGAESRTEREYALSWSSGRDPGRLFESLRTVGGEVRVRPGGDACPVAVHPGEWTRLGLRRLPFEHGAVYRWVPPFTGVRTERIRVEDERAAIHVRLLASDFATPAAGRTVELHRFVAATGGSAATVVERADSAGRLSFRELGAGVYTIVAEGATVAHGVPHVARLALDPSVPTGDAVCTLVVPDRAIAVTLLVQASFEPDRELAPKLFLERMDAPAELVPIAGVLRPGEAEHVVALARGTWRAAVLPLGICDVVPGTERIVVAGTDPHRALVQVAADPHRTAVTLRGIPREAFPLRVFAVGPDVPGHGLDDLLFLGRPHWTRAEMAVPSLPGPIHVAAVGARGVFVSSGEIRLDGSDDRVDVEMVAGTRVQVVWRGWDPDVAADAILVVDAGGERWALRPVCRFANAGGEIVPAATAWFPAKRGTIARVECLRLDGTTVWEQSVDLDRSHVVIEHEARRPD